jgi:hypothetical protein
MVFGVLFLLPTLLASTPESFIFVSTAALSQLGQLLLFGGICISAFAFVLDRVSRSISKPTGPRMAVAIFAGLVVMISADVIAICYWAVIGQTGGWLVWVSPAFLLAGLGGGIACCRLASHLDASSQQGSYSPL